MTVKLRSGRFESSIAIPLFAPEQAKKDFIDAWLDLMAAGVKCGKAYPRS